MDLLDELQLMVHPVALREGKPVLNGIKNTVNLKLTTSQPFKKGNVLLCYQPESWSVEVEWRNRPGIVAVWRLRGTVFANAVRERSNRAEIIHCERRSAPIKSARTK